MNELKHQIMIDVNIRLLKPEQVAEILNISRSFAYQLMKTGALPVVRLGKACRVRPQDLGEYIERNLHSM